MVAIRMVKTEIDAKNMIEQLHMEGYYTKGYKFVDSICGFEVSYYDRIGKIYNSNIKKFVK